MIYFECKPDEKLVRTLTGFGWRELKHGANKSEICKLLEKSRGCKALLDEDPLSHQEPYFEKLPRTAVKNFPAWSLRLLQDHNSNTVILLCPKLEGWILNLAKSSGINPADFSLPAGENKLHELINTRLENYQKLIKELLKRKTPALISLQKLLRKK